MIGFLMMPNHVYSAFSSALNNSFSLPWMIMQVSLSFMCVGSASLRMMTFKFLLSQVTIGLSLHASVCSPRVHAATASRPNGPVSCVVSSDAACAKYLKLLLPENGSNAM